LRKINQSTPTALEINIYRILLLKKVNYYLLIITFLFPIALHTQVRDNYGAFFRALDEKESEFKNEIDFVIAKKSFVNNDWDKTLYYSMKQLNGNDSNVLNDYCYYFRGYAFKEKGLYDQSRIELLRVSNNFDFYHKVILKLGEIALEKNEYERAINYFTTVKTLTDDTGFGFKKSTIDHNLGLCYFHLQKYSLAKSYLIKGNDLYQIEKDTTGLIISYMDIANLYYEQYQDALAIPYFEKAYQLSKHVNNFELKQNAALNMAVVEENRQHYKEALVYRAEYEPWRDSFNNFSY
jgi:tetratricopeptide (TPR) repeat protein